MPLVALFVANRYPLANPTQVFKSECLARDDGFVYQGLRDTVIDILLEAAFSPRVLAQAAFGVLGVDLLQPLAAGVVALARLLHLRAGKCLTLAIRSQIDNPQINAQRSAVWFGRLWNVGRFAPLRHMQVVDTASSDQISATNFPRRVYQHFVLTWAEQQAADDSAIQGVERDAIKAHQAIGAGVIANAAPWAKLRTCLAATRLHRFESLHCLGSRADGKLSAEAEVQAGLAVDAVMGGIRIRDVLITTYLRNPGCRRVEGALGRGQCTFMAVNVHLNADSTDECFVHSDRFYHRQLDTERRAALPPRSAHACIRPDGRGLRAAHTMSLLAEWLRRLECLPDSGMIERGSQQIGVEPRGWQRRDPDDVDARGPRGGHSG